MRARAAGGIAALVLGAALWSAAPVSAAPTEGAHRTTITASERSAALRFWTDARLRSARSLDAPAATSTPSAAPDATGRPATAPKGEEVRVAPLPAPRAAAAPAPALAASAPAPWTGGGLISTTAGKVFFQNAGGGTFACSATVANADNRSLVLTAGHCVVDAGTGEVYRNWVFIPGYANGDRPYGTFTASALFHLDQYVATAGNANYDLAFARLAPLNGRSLGDTVGAQGIAFNSATGREVHSFGYGGSAAEGNGERLNHCSGVEYPDAGREGSTMWGIDCVQTGGSSGGGFLADFDGGGGYLVGNISVSAGSSEYHPVLGNEALDLYRRAGAA
ncbi:trypsin-like peptidase domain-containing protein [Streptomyces sp. NPDC047046]|uniref:trypsin-like serine peptidase n=1 Tax=Streptomyces sp. NPDC047046 TaxID=3155378 RepID=UPI0033D1167C